MEQMLCREYGIRALSLREVPSGWSASAWRVHADGGDYFLKVYDKHKPSTKGWVERIDSYMPVALWLHDNTALREKMTAPLLTKDGCYKWEDDAFLYMVFLFIDGQTICDAELTPEQVREIARIVAELHAHGAEVPVPTDSLRETFDVSFCATLNDRLVNIQDASLREELSPYVDTIARTTAALQETAVSLPKSQLRYALCHTDIHGWNLMQAQRLYLIDWEGLKLAPVESDLFSFTDTFFFGYAWEEFLSVYGSIRKGHQVNPDAMRFYRFRRRLEDIHVFLESILLDDLPQEEMERSLYHLKRECEMLRVMS